MVIYECDMCGKQSNCEQDMHQMSVGGRKEDENLPFGENVECVMVCRECHGKIGDFIRGYKSRMEGADRLLNARQQVSDGGDGDVLDDFYVIDMGGGEKQATRSRLRVFSASGRSHPPLTRRDLYRGRMGEAEYEYAHAFMCGGFPMEHDPERPSKDEWLDQKPYDFEVDRFVSEKLFGGNK